MSTAATALSGAAVVVGVLVLVASRSPRMTLHVLLDLLLAAGLLRLAAAETWRAIAVAAAIVGIRKLASGGILRPRHRGEPEWGSRPAA
jgi:hypothetical protein